jgi:undecaprenyl-diphosphatase
MTGGGPGDRRRRRIERRPSDLIWLAAGAVVLVLCAQPVHADRVGSLEADAFRLVNDLPSVPFALVWAPMQLGNFLVVPVAVLAALAFRRWRLAAALVLVVPLKLALERMVKLLVQRERPGTTVPEAVLRGVHPGGLSYVSGHAIITFAIAGLLVLVLPRRWGIVAFVLATLNAVARVYLGAHNPLDVVGGAAVGLALAAALDLVLDVARDRGGSRPERTAPTREDRAA